MLGRSASRNWRRWFRLRLLGLMALVLVVGAFLGWICYGARVQREAVAAIQNVGGRVAYDWEWKNSDWIRSLSRTGVTDEGLLQLSGLTNLKVGYVMKTGVTDAGLEKLRRALPDLNIRR